MIALRLLPYLFRSHCSTQSLSPFFTISSSPLLRLCFFITIFFLEISLLFPGHRLPNDSYAQFLCRRFLVAIHLSAFFHHYLFVAVSVSLLLVNHFPIVILLLRIFDVIASYPFILHHITGSVSYSPILHHHDFITMPLALFHLLQFVVARHFSQVA